MGLEGGEGPLEAGPTEPALGEDGDVDTHGLPPLGADAEGGIAEDRRLEGPGPAPALSLQRRREGEALGGGRLGIEEGPLPGNAAVVEGDAARPALPEGPPDPAARRPARGDHEEEVVPPDVPAVVVPVDAHLHLPHPRLHPPGEEDPSLPGGEVEGPAALRLVDADEVRPLPGGEGPVDFRRRARDHRRRRRRRLRVLPVPDAVPVAVGAPRIAAVGGRRPRPDLLEPLLETQRRQRLAEVVEPVPVGVPHPRVAPEAPLVEGEARVVVGHPVPVPVGDGHRLPPAGEEPAEPRPLLALPQDAAPPPKQPRVPVEVIAVALRRPVPGLEMVEGELRRAGVRVEGVHLVAHLVDVEPPAVVAPLPR